MFRRSFAPPTPTAAQVGAIPVDKIWGQRLTVSNLAANATTNVVVPLAVAQPNTNYTVSSLAETSALRVDRVISRTATDVTLAIINTDALAVSSGTIHLLIVVD